MGIRPIDGNALLERYGEPCHSFADVIEDMPTLDYAPVVHGEWIEDDTPFAKQRKCSVCGKNDNPKTAISGHYCWFCGAKMDGGKTDGCL